MPVPRLPLNALRAFEAAVRLGSMSAAATELGVTHGAVSRHVKTLEDQFGMPLLRRLSQSVEPSPEGEQLAASLKESFSTMHLAVSRLQPGPLTLSCSSTIMMYWLLPRLERFKRANPGIELCLNVSFGKVDFIRDEISVAIRTTMYEPPALAIRLPLIAEEIGPICHPSYASQRRLKTLDDLQRSRLLVAATRPNAWSEWSAAIGRPDLTLKPQETFEHFYLAIQAAACGLGFALAPRILAETYIQSGHVLAPFGFCEGPHRYEMWIAPHVRARADLRLLADWLKCEMQASRAPTR